eukprot:gene7156-8533_t
MEGCEGEEELHDSDGKAVFATAPGGDFWVCILEKAYAKHMGSYSNLSTGFPAVALKSLTGCRTLMYTLAGGVATEMSFTNLSLRTLQQSSTGISGFTTGASYSFPKFWDYLMDCDRRNYVMVLDSMGTDIHSEEEGPDSAVFGMVGGHAYSLIRTVHHKGFRLCRIRNPWGTFEWGGDWSDKSPLWQEHPDVKSVCNPRLDKEDGIFWMAFADVCAHFRAVTVCRLAQNGALG